MLDLNEFAKDVHAVSVEHGWWEGEENNDIDTKIALIHAEWSEALEEYRAGRLMVWRLCMESGGVCDGEACENWENGTCATDDMASKPEGIAVELIDGCIRIMDLMAAKEMEVYSGDNIAEEKRTLPQLVAMLHYATAMAGSDLGLYLRESEAENWLCSCLLIVRERLEAQGVDMDELLRIKHEYNKTRPYRHGGKRC